jgi:hypothetical protein
MLDRCPLCGFNAIETTAEGDRECQNCGAVEYSYEEEYDNDTKRITDDIPY